LLDVLNLPTDDPRRRTLEERIELRAKWLANRTGRVFVRSVEMSSVRVEKMVNENGNILWQVMTAIATPPPPRKDGRLPMWRKAPDGEEAGAMEIRMKGYMVMAGIPQPQDLAFFEDFGKIFSPENMPGLLSGSAIWIQTSSRSWTTMAPRVHPDTSDENAFEPVNEKPRNWEIRFLYRP